MKLIKLKEDHYVVVDDSKIKEGDWLLDTTDNTIWGCYKDMSIYLFPECKKITHSTRPFGGSATAISLHGVKELIGEVDVEKKADKRYFEQAQRINDVEIKGYILSATKGGFIDGYNQAIEDNKEKKYTEEDMRMAFLSGVKWDTYKEDEPEYKMNMEEVFSKTIKSIQPKTEWEVEFVDGKLKLK